MAGIAYDDVDYDVLYWIDADSLKQYQTTKQLHCAVCGIMYDELGNIGQLECSGHPGKLLYNEKRELVWSCCDRSGERKFNECRRADHSTGLRNATIYAAVDFVQDDWKPYRQAVMDSIPQFIKPTAAFRQAIQDKMYIGMSKADALADIAVFRFPRYGQKFT